MNHAQKRMLIAVAAISLTAAACHRKAAMAPPPPAPRAATPAATPRPAPPPARTATVQSSTATTPASRYPDAATRARINRLLAKIEDAYFDYDKAWLRPDALKALQADSIELRNILKDHLDYKVTIEGHCAHLYEAAIHSG